MSRYRLRSYIYNKLEFEYIIVLIMLLLYFLFVFIILPSSTNHVETKFKEYCNSVGGTTVYDGRQYQCFKH